MQESSTIEILESIHEICSVILRSDDEVFRAMSIEHMRDRVDQLRTAYYAKESFLRRINKDAHYDYQLDN